MKTTIDLPADLVREMKLRAVHDNRKLKDLAADLIRSALRPADQEGAGPTPLPKCLPVLRTRARSAGEPAARRTPQEMADWIKQVDLELDVERHEKASGR